MKVEIIHILRGIRKTGVWLLNKRYYIFALWVLGWIIPVVLVALDKIKSAESIPQGNLLTFAKTLNISLTLILPSWSWELNRQWAELSIFKPTGVAVSSLLIVILIVQYIREAKEAQRIYDD